MDAVLYRAAGLPVLQNRVFDSEADAMGCARGDVTLVQDARTGFVHNRDFDPRLLVYDANYQNEQAESALFQRHLDHVAALLERHFAGRSLIEVGCGKGRFLERLQSRGFDITGMDPAYEGDNPAIRKEFFTPASGLSADAIVLRHVLEHIVDPASFLAMLRDANGGKGGIYIEVPCVDWIREHRAWFDVFYEHVNYFRRSDFERLFGTVHEIGHTFGGQYISVVADLASLRDPAGQEFEPVRFPPDFRASVERHAARIGRRGAGRSAIWGASSKGVIFSLLTGQAGGAVGMAIDINPAKQGKYLPATGLQVRSPSDAMARLAPGTDIYVMNSNYLEEIRAVTQGRFTLIPVDRDVV
jgi:hypothetical protein